MSKLNHTAQDPIPLSQAVETRNLSIDFQLPALLCYRTLAVQAIFTKTDLIATISHILASQPHLVRPGGTVVNNWKLTDLRGEIIDVKNWTAADHAGAMIMVTFDPEYLNGTFRGMPWQMHGPEHISDLLARGDPLSKTDFPRLLSHHSIVKVKFHYRSGRKRKTWNCMSMDTYFLPNDLKLSILASALVKIGNVQIRYLPQDPCNARESVGWDFDGIDTSYMYCNGSQTVGEVEGENNTKTLDFLIS